MLMNPRDSIELLLEPASLAATQMLPEMSIIEMPIIEMKCGTNRNAGSVASNQRGNNQPLDEASGSCW